MRKTTFLCSALALWLAAVTAQASVTDAPHNETNGIRCNSCHTYSFWWQYSPAQQQASLPTLVNTLCKGCHDSASPGPKVLTHSSEAIDSTSHGTWQRPCTACHNPHYQDQLRWIGNGSEPYLVTATITGVSYNNGSKQTTIAYSGATTNANWPVTAGSAETRDWANKSLTNPGRGLILVLDTAKAAKTFSIVAASGNTVTVKGEITAAMIDHNQAQSTTCNTFGLIYGDLIRNSINSRPVKFFDPNGGFVRAEGPETTGICQVCHTATAHYTNDGTMPSGSDTHASRNGADCTTCHRHAKGFKGDGHDNFSFAWAGNCATCHNPDGGAVNITTVIHGGKCGLCHEDTAGGGARRDGDPTNGIDGSALGATNSSTCVDCHINKLHLTAGAIHHDSAQGYAATGNCTHCHEDAPGKLTAPHNAVVTPAPECSSCHTATAGLATGMPVSGIDNKVHDACVTCHNTDGSLKAAYGRAIAIASGSCTTCHGLMRSSLHENVSDCAKCHVGFYDPAALDTTRGVGKHQQHYTDYRFACSTCHYNYPTRQTHMNGTLNVADPAVPIVFFDPANAAAQWNNSTVTCATTYCHGDGTALATGVVTTNSSPSWNTGTTTCASCHGYPPLYAQDSPKSNSHDVHMQFNPTCNYCHASTTTNGADITNMANHANGAYNVEPDTSAIFNWGGIQTPVPVNFTYVYDAGGGRCSNISCHIAMNFGDKSWGNFALDLNSTWSYGPTCYEVKFTSGVANGTPPYTYAWDFGDGTTSTEQNSDHIFPSNATYSVKLVAKDAKNHPATKIVPITPQPSANTPPTSNASVSLHGYTATLTDLSSDADYNTCGRSGTGQLAIVWGDGSPNTLDSAFPLTDTPSNRAYSHTYTTAGSYTIWEGISDNSGAQVAISKLITVPTTYVVSGRLTHAGGSGISGNRVELWSKNPDGSLGSWVQVNGSSAYTFTDANGNYTLNGSTDNVCYYVRVWNFGYINTTPATPAGVCSATGSLNFTTP